MRLAKINVDESKTSPIKGGLLSQQVPSTLPAEGTGFLTAFARTILGDRGTLQRNPSVIASPTLPEQFFFRAGFENRQSQFRHIQ